MLKKIILETILIIITVLVVICGYYLVIDIESKSPGETDDISIETKEFMSRKVFKLSPKGEEKSDKLILYFHGGAYVAEATNEHWDFLKKIVRDTKATVIMPDYPLTPKYTYKDVLNMVEPVYKDVLSKVDSKNLIMMGDSAGGGITLGLAEKLSENNINMPSKIILISPWLDTKMTNEKIDEVQKNDKKLSKDKLVLAGVSYGRGLNEKDDYFVNPINGNISKIKNIIIYTGKDDILNPDCHKLKAKANYSCTDVEIKEYEGAEHIWMIDNPETEVSKKAYNDLIEDIMNQGEE